MGTRSTVKFYKDNVFLCCVYQQYDGYLEGVGEDLKNFIKSKPFVDGISDDHNVFNGPNCFVAQYIKEFKKDVGGLYISHENDFQEYNYEVRFYNYTKGDFHIVIREQNSSEFTELINL